MRLLTVAISIWCVIAQADSAFAQVQAAKAKPPRSSEKTGTAASSAPAMAAAQVQSVSDLDVASAAVRPRLAAERLAMEATLANARRESMQNFATYQTSANFALLGLKNSGAGRTSTEYERLDASLEALATYKKGDEDNVFVNRNTFFLVPIWDSDTLVGAITSKMRDGELSPVMYGDRGWVRALEAIRVTKDGLPIGANKAVVVLECKFFGELDSTDGELWVTPTARCPELEQRVAGTKPMQSRLRIEDVLTAMKARAAREVQAKKEAAKPR